MFAGAGRLESEGNCDDGTGEVESVAGWVVAGKGAGGSVDAAVDVPEGGNVVGGGVGWSLIVAER